MNRKRLFWIGIGLVILGGLVWIGSGITVGGIPTPANAQAGEAEQVAAFIGDLSASATASGQVLPQREANISVETPGIVTAVYVRVGDTVQTDDHLVQLDNENLTLNAASAAQMVDIAEARLTDLLEPATATEIAAAEANVASAKAALNDLLDGPPDLEIAASVASVKALEASVWSSAAELSNQQNNVTASQIAAAEAALLSGQIRLDAARDANEENPNQSTHDAMLAAEQAVASAQVQLDDLVAGPDVTAAQSSVVAANARLDGSQADLNATLAGATAVDFAAAEAALAQAIANLAVLVDGPTAEAVLAAKAEVTQAQLSLAAAQAQLEKASIVAPFAGVVTAVTVNPGEFAAGVVVSLIDSSSLEVVLNVDEVDIGSFTAGQPATVSLETWPDILFDSEIVRIAPKATYGSSTLVSYDVHLTLAHTELPILTGMSANANLITAQREDVLLVPNRTIIPDRAAGKYYVTVQQADSTTLEVEVSIGLRDDENTQITSGLVAGDVLQIGETAVNDFGSPPFGSNDN
jgi:HlyD family secretion protein